VPVTFSVVEYLSHRFRKGGAGTTMDCTHAPEPRKSDTPIVSRHAQGEEA
jgi:hydrophobic/amphiphilic exporter-1 (mainly G- bacteria), HAE1 family